MTLIERLQKIAALADELSEMAHELHEEISEAVNNPAWVLPTEDNQENENDTKNSTSEDVSGGPGEES